MTFSLFFIRTWKQSMSSLIFPDTDPSNNNNLNCFIVTVIAHPLLDKEITLCFSLLCVTRTTPPGS